MHAILVSWRTECPRPSPAETASGSRIATVGAAAARRLDRLPPWCWPSLVALAAWPSASWAARRLLDDSDDPLGIVALAVLLLMLWKARSRFARAPRSGCLALATAFVAGSNLPVGFVPDLVRALLASVGIAAALAAIADRDEPIAPYAGLAVLALPLLSSLQFYAGFPLRVVTAEASRWLLIATGSAVARVGSALTVDGHLILVDAPCSGVQMAWVGYFSACVVAWMGRVPNRAFVARLPLVGLTVLVGNIVRNTVLVAADADGVRMTDAMHAAVGLAAFAVVSAAIAAIFARARRPPPPAQGARPAAADAAVLRTLSAKAPATGPAAATSVVGRVTGIRSRATTLHAMALAVVAALPLAATTGLSGQRAAEPARASEWPATWDGAELRPLALSPVEMRFAAHFPGTIGRFSTGTRTVVLRDVQQPTRRLHPAADCYRGLGFTIAGEHLERDDASQLWRCFVATRGEAGLRVCERIVDAEGHAYTDVSSWFWAASLSQSRGPWRAVTIATPQPGASS